MTLPSALLNALALAFYVPSAVCYAAILFLRAPLGIMGGGQPAPPTRLLRGGLFLLLFGIVAQFAAIGAWCLLVKVSPFASEYGTLTVLAWIIACGVAICDVRFRLSAVGAVALPVSCLVLFLAMLHLRAPVTDTELLHGPMISIHVLPILASYALFALAFGCASLYLVQNRLLKSHRTLGALRRLPPLVTLDHVAFHAVAYAFPFLTLGLIMGITNIYSGALRPAVPVHLWWTDIHNLVAFATWLLYLAYLGARLGLGWQGVRLQYILVIGLLMTLALYLAPTSTHNFNVPHPTARITR
jgi:ABC-type transport system involved in cytochrome c biogenesis permease subunit